MNDGDEVETAERKERQTGEEWGNQGYARKEPKTPTRGGHAILRHLGQRVDLTNV